MMKNHGHLCNSWTIDHWNGHVFFKEKINDHWFTLNHWNLGLSYWLSAIFQNMKDSPFSSRQNPFRRNYEWFLEQNMDTTSLVFLVTFPIGNWKVRAWYYTSLSLWSIWMLLVGHHLPLFSAIVLGWRRPYHKHGTLSAPSNIRVSHGLVLGWNFFEA